MAKAYVKGWGGGASLETYTANWLLKGQSTMRKSNRSTKFTRVKNTEFSKEGTVEEFLSTQFTVTYDDGTFGFLFYSDRGVTWKPLNENEKPTLSVLEMYIDEITTHQPNWEDPPMENVLFDEEDLL